MARSKAYTQTLSWAAAGILLLTGCTVHTAGPSDEQLRQQAAADANQVHHDLKAAGRETRQALVQARRETKDAVAGARQGWKSDSGSGPGAADRLDINHASVASLETLPGVHASTARRIVAGRPFASARELESRGLVTHAEYQQIATQITVE